MTAMTLPMTAPMLPPVTLAPALSEAGKDIRDRARHLAFGCSRPFAYDYMRVHLLENADRIERGLSHLDTHPELKATAEELIRRVRAHEWWSAYGLLRDLTPTK